MSANKEVRVTFKGIDKTREAFGKIKQNFKNLNEQLCKVKLGLGKIGGALTAAFSVGALKKIIDSGAEIGKLACKLDISTQSLSELKYAGERCGVEFNTLTSGLQEMAMRVSDAARGTGEAKDALNLLGLSAKELNAIAPNEQIALIADQLSRVTNEGDRTQLAIKLFGSNGAALLPILEQGEDGIKRFREEAKKLGISLSSSECEAMTKFNAELAKLQAVLTGLMTSVLVPILPVITAFFEAIRQGHPAVTFIITAISTLLAFRLAAWFIGVTTAVRAFSIALMANPLGLVAVGVSTLIASLISLKQWFAESTKSTEEFNETLKKTKELSTIAIPKQTIGVMNKRNELQSEARQIFEQTRTPLERHNQQMEKLNNLLKQGLIDQDTYNRAMKQNTEGLDQISDKADDVFTMVEKHSKSAADNLISSFANATFGVGNQMKSLKETCSDFFNQLQSDILSMTLKGGLSSIFGGDGGMFGGGGGGMMGGMFGSGGIIGGMFDAVGSIFDGFFAEGGTVRPGRAHVVGDGGEPELFIPNSVGSIVPFSKLEGAGSNIVVNMNIQTPDIASFNHSRSQIAADMARQIGRASRNL